jgi:hypothetical protein
MNWLNVGSEWKTRIDVNYVDNILQLAGSRRRTQRPLGQTISGLRFEAESLECEARLLHTRPRHFILLVSLYCLLCLCCCGCAYRKSNWRSQIPGSLWQEGIDAVMPIPRVTGNKSSPARSLPVSAPRWHPPPYFCSFPISCVAVGLPHRLEEGPLPSLLGSDFCLSLKHSFSLHIGSLFQSVYCAYNGRIWTVWIVWRLSSRSGAITVISLTPPIATS